MIRGDLVDGNEPANDRITIERVHLEKLQKIASIGAVASSVAHEFNNILTTILNYAKLGMQNDDLASNKAAFEKILHSARRAAKITTGVLALSRNRSERKAPTNVVELVEEVLAVLEKDLSTHQVRLERDFKDQPVAEVIAPQIEQVLMNLVINARQAMPKGGTVRVSVQTNPSAGMVEISVRDSGVGIEPDKMSHIFDAFFTTKEGPDASGQGGSGLGLTICREIIERHQGRIRVESTAGKGATFTVKLPLAKPAVTPHRNAA